MGTVVSRHPLPYFQSGVYIAQVDPRKENLREAHDLHNCLVTHAVQFGIYPDLELALRLLPHLERRLLRLRSGRPTIPMVPPLLTHLHLLCMWPQRPFRPGRATATVSCREDCLVSFTPRGEHQGWPNLTHRGIVATLLDEARTQALQDRGQPAVTATLTVRYH